MSTTFTERQVAEFWEKGWKRLLHRSWKILGVQHPLSFRIGRRFLMAGQRSVIARRMEKEGITPEELAQSTKDHNEALFYGRHK
jgi:hypothetical protein